MHTTPSRARCWILPAAALALVASAHAQETPAVGQEQAVPLTFKYTKGQVQHLRATLAADMSLSPVGRGDLPDLPLSVKLQMAFSEKVIGTNKGTGTLAVNHDSLTVSNNMAGQQTVVRIRGGKVASASLNGSPLSKQQLAQAAARMKDVPGLKQQVLRRGPDGREVKGPGGQDASAFGPVLMVPNRPVKPGETWEHVELVKPTIVGLPNSGQVAPPVEVRFTYTLKSVESRGGKQFAIIETSGSSSNGGQAGLNHNYRGTSRFDIGRGVVVAGQYVVDTTVELPAAALGIPPGEGTPERIRVAGSTQIKMEEAPAAPAAPAAAKPARGRTRKK